MGLRIQFRDGMPTWYDQGPGPPITKHTRNRRNVKEKRKKQKSIAQMKTVVFYTPFSVPEMNSTRWEDCPKQEAFGAPYLTDIWIQWLGFVQICLRIS